MGYKTFVESDISGLRHQGARDLSREVSGCGQSLWHARNICSSTILDHLRFFNVMKGLSHASASYIVNNYPQARHSIFDTKRLPVKITVPSRRSYRKIGNCEHIVVFILNHTWYHLLNTETNMKIARKKTFHRIEILTGTLTSSDNWFFPESGDYSRIQSLGKNSSEASRWLYFETRFVVVVFFKGFF